MANYHLFILNPAAALDHPQVEINNRPISVISEALGGSNVDNCPHACVARPCGPLAECIPNLESYECQCNPKNTQCNKAEELTSDQLNKEKNFILITKDVNPVKYANGDERNVDKDNNEENDDYYYYEYDEVDDNDSNNDESNNNRNDKEKIIIRIDKHSKNLKNNAMPASPAISTTSTSTTTTTTTTTTTSTTTTTPPPPANIYEIIDESYQNSFVGPDDDLVGEDTNTDPIEDNVDSEIANNDKVVEGKYMSFNDNDNNEEFFHRIHNKKHHQIKQGSQMKKHYRNNNKRKKNKQPKPIKANEKHTMSYRPEDDTIIDEILIDEMDKIMKDDSHGKGRNEDLDDYDDVRRRGHGYQGSLEAVADEQEEGHASDLPISRSNRDGTPMKYKNKLLHKYHGACFTGTDSYFHYSDGETMRRIISYQIDLNLRFRTHSTHGVILWSGRHSAHEDDDFLSLGIENG